jgi:hypothetical protein
MSFDPKSLFYRGIVDGFGKQRMAKQGAETTFLCKGEEFWVVDHSGSGQGVDGFRVDFDL